MRKTSLGGDCGEGHRHNGSGNSIIESALHVERLPHSIRNSPIRHDRRTKSRVGRGQGGAHKQRIPRAEAQDGGGSGRSQCGRQRQTYGKEPDVVPEIFSQVGESYPAGVCEQHPDKRDLGNDLR